MNISYNFIPPGSTCEVKRNMVFLDVGNDFCPGIIDNHTDKGGNHCASYLAFHNPDFVLSVLDENAEEYIITVHERPDFDAILSAYIATKIIKKEVLSNTLKILADFADQIDAGKMPFSQIDENNFLLYFYVLDDSDYYQRLKKGFDLLDHITQQEYSPQQILSGVPFKDTNKFDKYKNKISGDYKNYLADLKISEKLTAHLYNIESKNIESVEGLLFEDPSSNLFKFWARYDKINSKNKHGFKLLFVIFENKRFVISVDPSSPYTLKGLGDKLEEEEVKQRKILGKIREGANRPGYNNPDPWYDGRNPLHHYTIIDTPRNGTVLTKDTISKILLNSNFWIKK